MRPTPVMQVVREHAARLAGAGILTPGADARLLAQHVLGMDAVRLRTAALRDVDPAALGRLAELVDRRVERIPLQHLTGETGFRTLTLGCRSGVFIPRPETERLAGHAIDRLRALDGASVVAEPCTGSGAVALAIAAEVPQVEVIATDLSAAAVALAQDNLRRVRAVPGLAQGARCRLLRGDLLEPLPGRVRGGLDLVVSNPPYLTPGEVAACSPEVREHDPAEALVAGPDGNEVVSRLLKEAREWLRPGGAVLLEIPEERADQLVAMAREVGFAEVAVHRDLAGRERVLEGALR